MTSFETGDDETPKGVAATGIRIAHYRADESRRPDRLFDDPYAAAFVAAGPTIAGELDFDKHSQSEIEAIIAFAAVGEFSFTIRTRFFDDYLSEASAQCPQAVVVAAGVDARAFRLDWQPDSTVFEVDLPEVFAFKEPILEQSTAQPRCTRIVVPADLTADWATPLLESGFDPNRRTAWLAEGLMLYLTSDQAAHLLHVIGELSAPGSRLSYEHGNIADDELTDRVTTTEALRPAAATWKGGLQGDPLEWLTSNGWDATVSDISTVGTVYGRSAPPHSALEFVTAIRR
jgi:methyltransferase (TIGR00027 family)